MNPKELILEEMEETPESLLMEVLNFLRFLKAQQTKRIGDYWITSLSPLYSDGEILTAKAETPTE